MKKSDFIEGNGIHSIEASFNMCGSDIFVIIRGGTRHHIGAVALANPRKSLSNKEKISASASVMCISGHKEDLWARKAALSLAAAYNTNVLVSVGIHIDNATMQDIDILKMNFARILGKIIGVKSLY